MFGAFHLNLYQFFYAFFLGAVFGYIYVKTGRLRYTIALHATVNFLGGVAVPALLRKILPFLERLEQGAFNAEEIFSQLLPVLPALLLYAAYGFLLIGCTLTTVVLGIVLHRRLSFARERRRHGHCGAISVCSSFLPCARGLFSSRCGKG